MNKKLYNTRDNFEDVYLRTNCFKKGMDSLASQDAEKYLKDPEFNKCISHVARSMFTKHQVRLINCGFEQEDVRSITSIYGLTFMATKPETETSRDMYMLMFNYISQRWSNFLIRLDIKFFNNEHIGEVRIDGSMLSKGSGYKVGYSDIERPISESKLAQDDPNLLAVINGEGSEFLAKPIADQIDILKDSVQEIKTELRRYIHPKTREHMVYRNKLKVHLKAAREELAALRKKVSDEKKALSKLKSKLAEDPKKYAERLAFLATSKHISVDVRKNAQKMCRKYAINYVMWAKNHIEQKNLNPDYFISLK